VQVAEEPVLLGCVGTLVANRDWVANEPCFWVWHADVLTNVNLTKMLAFHRQTSPQAALGLCRVRDSQPL
jgi:mannose-1-phosphate guanylyltransferase